MEPQTGEVFMGMHVCIVVLFGISAEFYKPKALAVGVLTQEILLFLVIILRMEYIKDAVTIIANLFWFISYKNCILKNIININNVQNKYRTLNPLDPPNHFS
jgi:hypothetical protein